MQPEISHRCESCGASIREQAMFCPECGQALTQSSANTKPHRDEETPKPSVADNEAEVNRAMLLERANAATNIFSAADKPSAIAPLETPNVSTANQPAAAVEPAKTEAGNQAMNSSAAAVSKHGTYEKARDSLHRASSATRGALADNVKRVEKIRHVSSAMFEEASYDPSLRFVLVALGLFVVFLVLLLLSKVMG
ncbi:MAG TPA: zinc-ribbon domain-containing protein [Pyrinomonadaceae bacterium]|nr:zinc-ribbon domain-containing protein [Pyrinomonadaceae bacterium]